MTSQHHPHVLVTGASGFVGAELCRRLLQQGAFVTAVSRHEHEVGGVACHQVALGEFGPETDWRSALHEVDIVVHLAARVHVMRDLSMDPLEAFRRVNVTVTESLARAAATAGVKRFIFLSSIKVNGEKTLGSPFREQDDPNPQDPYGISKHEAELVLKRISAETGMQIVILRPPLVYGPNVTANFFRLLRWVDQGVPLPFAAVHNRRSMIYLGNLVDAIATCIDHPSVAGNTYLLSDSDDISTPELIGWMASAFGKSARLWPLPQSALRLLGTLTAKNAEVDRLLGSLQIDSSRFREDTGWVPPFGLQQGLAKTVAWYQDQSR